MQAVRGFAHALKVTRELIGFPEQSSRTEKPKCASNRKRERCLKEAGCPATGAVSEVYVHPSALSCCAAAPGVKSRWKAVQASSALEIDKGGDDSGRRSGKNAKMGGFRKRFVKIRDQRRSAAAEMCSDSSNRCRDSCRSLHEQLTQLVRRKVPLNAAGKTQRNRLGVLQRNPPETR
ncbi:hypothetical protein TGGT1_215650 [Toxoplasma gondii GT1]|uniref:Uncharacterized protein n=2 Tax=Toxoplasma gondii TaxID=5811 RepID=S7W593_TOXGG|nr:hypothetical protein TGGT1_215650 [Toxoplasma gondii GT1]KAF4639972.1 hypothetical protein TGRH88_038970 [Toxoplasma gondii]